MCEPSRSFPKCLYWSIPIYPIFGFKWQNCLHIVLAWQTGQTLTEYNFTHMTMCQRVNVIQSSKSEQKIIVIYEGMKRAPGFKKRPFWASKRQITNRVRLPKWDEYKEPIFVPRTKFRTRYSFTDHTAKIFNLFYGMNVKEHWAHLAEKNSRHGAKITTIFRLS